MEKVHGVGSERDKYLHRRRVADRIGHSERLRVRKSIVFSAGNRNVLVGSVRQEERGAARFLERLRREHTLNLRPEVDVVIKDWEPPGHSTLLTNTNPESRIRPS